MCDEVSEVWRSLEKADEESKFRVMWSDNDEGEPGRQPLRASLWRFYHGISLIIGFMNKLLVFL